MRVSILVPVYNVERYIERCARSLFEQTYQDLEYVFVNDCSPDCSMEILQRVMDDYPGRKSAVKIINHDKNRGVAASRNTLLDNAEEEFVSWVDADDWLERDAIEVLVKKQKETDADIVSGNALMYYTDRVEKLEQSLVLTKNEIVLDKLRHGWQSVLWGRIIRRSLVEKNKVRAVEGCDMAEDKFLMALLSYYAESFEVCEKVIYNYERRNYDSIVGQQSDEKALSNGLRLLQNNVNLQKFFSDKEVAYYEEASKQTMIYAFHVLKMIVRFNKRQHFQYVVETIDATWSKYWPLIGWSTKGVKGSLLHHYSSVWIWLTAKRALRFAKRNHDSLRQKEEDEHA